MIKLLFAATSLLTLIPFGNYAQIHKRYYSIVDGNNQFALELYLTLAKDKNNLFFSPYSLSSALAMTYDGARENTAEQMMKTLHFANDKPKLHQEFSDIKASFSEHQDTSLIVVNALWGQNNFSFEAPFIETNKTYYGAGLTLLNFGEAEKSRKTINDWVEQNTRKKITELLPPGSITMLTRLILTNAIYFKANWSISFNKNATKDLDFFIDKETPVKVPMMQQHGIYNFGENEFASILELPYKDNRYSMFILLPKTNIEELESNLTFDNYTNWMQGLTKCEIPELLIPKFKFTKEKEMRKPFKSLGMVDAFSDTDANFKGISSQQYLYISEVYHKAFIDVNEKGTEAAAATAVTVVTRSAPPQTKEFKANHPFIFIIQDNVSSCIIFIGKVMNPSEK